MRPAFITIAAGTFVMGGDGGLPDEQPAHEVWVDEFKLAVHPVTNAEYRRFLAATGHRAPACCGTPGFDLPEQPVVAVDWFDAVAYCGWLTDVTGLPCRLPTEAEREKAARGGVAGVRYPWGDDAGDAAGPLAQPPVVGRDAPNALGLHNLGDLVHEWCEDWYHPAYYLSSPLRNPRGPRRGQRRSSRGGSWRHQLCVSRCGARSSLQPDRAYADYGFRIAVGTIAKES